MKPASLPEDRVPLSSWGPPTANHRLYLLFKRYFGEPPAETVNPNFNW